MDKHQIALVAAIARQDDLATFTSRMATRLRELLTLLDGEGTKE